MAIRILILAALLTTVASGVQAAGAAPASAPAFAVGTASAPRAIGGQQRFPVLAETTPVARAINLYLQSSVLGTVIGKDPAAAFAALPESLRGVDFIVTANTGRLLSVRVDRYEAARIRHPQSSGHSFDAASGRPVTQADLFSPEGYGRLRQRIARERVGRVQALQAVAATRPQDEALAEASALYADCLASIRGDTLTDDALFIGGGRLALEQGDCAAVDYLEFDVLRPLRVDIPLTELAGDLNDYGRCLLLGDGDLPCPAPRKEGPQPGTYAGTLGARRIELVIERRYDGDRISGAFVVDGRRHRLEGRNQRDGKAKLYETGASADDLICEFTLFTRADGRIEGTWRSFAESALLPLALKPLR